MQTYVGVCDVQLARKVMYEIRKYSIILEWRIVKVESLFYNVKKGC